RFFHPFRAFATVPTDKKKCGLRVVAVQQIEKLRSHRRIRPVVEGERQLPRRVRAANRTPEELRARMCGAVSGGSPQRRDRTRHRNEQRIHAVLILQESQAYRYWLYQWVRKRSGVSGRQK